MLDEVGMNLPSGKSNDIEVVKQIAKLVSEGDSIQLARTKVIGSATNSEIARKVMQHPLYVETLNKYLIRTGRTQQFALVRGMLVTKKITA